ncbi:hypothetical protein RRG08_040083 [Elysia crispata]|uniref:Uncharacterized protein n=1 Tax=Elysia crispata TaxID=231223 RepID=A0AAE1CND9_9GAST|nr:hypothetical protein RRG08_040083 [Elysia crispata]
MTSPRIISQWVACCTQYLLQVIKSRWLGGLYDLQSVPLSLRSRHTSRTARVMSPQNKPRDLETYLAKARNSTLLKLSNKNNHCIDDHSDIHHSNSQLGVEITAELACQTPGKPLYTLKTCTDHTSYRSLGSEKSIIEHADCSRTAMRCTFQSTILK